MFLSLLSGFRAARGIGAASRREKLGDIEGSMNIFGHVLRILERPGVDVEMAWCRASASVALWGYCRAAYQLQKHDQIVAVLERWRPRYLPWVKSPSTPQEGDYLKWFEDFLKSRGRTASNGHGSPRK